jgi:hypothetical protein
MITKWIVPALVLCGTLIVMRLAHKGADEFGTGDVNDWCFGVLILLLVTFVGGVAGWGLSCWVGESLPCKRDAKPSRIVNLASLRGADMTSGSISGGAFLIVGGFGGDRTYYYYEQWDGYLAPGHLNGDSGVYIYEETRSGAVLETYNWHFARRWYALIGTREFGHTYYFRVPVGTVERQTSLK